MAPRHGVKPRIIQLSLGNVIGQDARFGARARAVLQCGGIDDRIWRVFADVCVSSFPDLGPRSHRLSQIKSSVHWYHEKIGASDIKDANLRHLALKCSQAHWRQHRPRARTHIGRAHVIGVTTVRSEGQSVS